MEVTTAILRLLYACLLFIPYSVATISQTNSSSMTTTFLPTLTPMNVGRSTSTSYTSLNGLVASGINFSSSCGGCTIIYESVKVRYWPATSSNTACVGNSSYYGTNLNLERSPATKTSHSVKSSTIIPVGPNLTTKSSELIYAVDPDGFTYTFPSVYVAYPTIYAADRCGPLGRTYSALTLSFTSGELSTVEGRMGPTKSFNFADLPCPPLSVATADWYNFHPMAGQTYAPMLAPAQQLYSLDPLWSSCYVDIYEGYDPPHALTPVVALVATTDPAVTTKSDNPQPQSHVASGTVQTPNPAISDPKPVSVTASPLNQDPPLEVFSQDPTAKDHTDEPTISQGSPSKPLSTEGGNGQISPAAPSLDVNPAASSQSKQNMHDINTIVQGSAAQQPPAQASATKSDASSEFFSSTPIAPTFPTMTQLPHNIVLTKATVVTSTQTTPANTDSSHAVSENTATDPLIIAGQTARIDSSVLVIGSQTITQGASAVSIAGTPVSLPAGASALAIAGSTIPLPNNPPNPSINPSPTPPPNHPTSQPLIFQLGSNTLTIDPAGDYIIDSQTLSPNRPAITISGTLLSLAPSFLIYDSQTYALPSISRPLLPPNSINTLAGQSFTPIPSGYLVAGQTLVTGGAGLVLSGTPVTLGSQGLVISTSAAQGFSGTFTAGGEIFTVVSKGVLVAGQTLLPGQAVSVDGKTMSLAGGGSVLVFGSETVVVAATTKVGLGGVILGGFGAAGAGGEGPMSTQAANGSSYTPFLGAAPRYAVVGGEVGLCVVAVLFFGGVL